MPSWIYSFLSNLDKVQRAFELLFFTLKEKLYKRLSLLNSQLKIIEKKIIVYFLFGRI